MKQSVLVTGCNGAVGQPVCRELMSRGHAVRGFDRARYAAVTDCVIGDLADRDAVRSACRGVDTVVHLGAAADPTVDFLDVLAPCNIIGTYHVFDAAREMGVKRVVFASSLHVGCDYDGPPPLPVDRRYAPSNMYGVSKIAGEAMGQVYAKAHGITVLSVRIGFLPRSERYIRMLEANQGQAAYISPGDAGRFFALAVEAELSEKYAVVIAVGKAQPEKYDLGPARRLLGYEPRDAWPQGMSLPE